MHIVWFKRDLRVQDHEALARAASQGIVMPLYIFEPELWCQPDMSHRHYHFLKECILELDQVLSKLGQKLIVKIGNAVDVLNTLHQQHSITALWSHQETWNGWTYERDKNVKRWCKEHQIPWYEPVQNGVVRVLKNRDGWAKQWEHTMHQSQANAPIFLHRIDENSERLPHTLDMKDREISEEHQQKGGRSQGLILLQSFLYERGEGYTKEMSSPVTAFESCSRLSPHIAFGTLSLREVLQACEQRDEELNRLPYALQGKWGSALRSFSGRLRWHCHFIQKLEDEPRIEFENMHPLYDGLREKGFNQAYFEAWKEGKTGFPMIDACMRALIATGWINFRMRAMLMSFASYHLWLHWREPALHLAKLFTDYEPGIHYSQVQMQSGTTGINAIRIYNPVKQSIDQDPEGKFIRQWIPELRHIEQAYIHTPWRAYSQMNGYPMPIIDEKAARLKAAQKIYDLRKNNTAHQEISKKVVEKHGSRKSPRSRQTVNHQKNQYTQLKLFE